MVVINNFTIINNGTQLAIDVETSVGNLITSMLLWDMNTFKNYSLATSLNYKLEQINNKEVFVLDATELNLTVFSDLWFIEIKSNGDAPIGNCANCQTPALGITYNLSPYYQCLLNSILNSQINSCTTCNDIVSNNSSIVVNLLIESVKKGVELGYYAQSIEMIKKLQKLCSLDTCSNCNTAQCSTCSTFTQVI